MRRKWAQSFDWQVGAHSQLAYTIILPQCAMVFRSHGVHLTIPTQHICIHHTTIRNVRQWPTVPMEGIHNKCLETIKAIASQKPCKPRTCMGCMWHMPIRLWCILQPRWILENHEACRFHVQEIHWRTRFILHIWTQNARGHWSTQKVGRW